MYLPLIGLVILAVVAIFSALRRTGRRISTIVAMTLLALAAIALSTRTILRNREYHSSLTLAETVLSRWPTPIAHDMVGTALSEAGRHDEALPHLRLAVTEYPVARYSLGAELLNLGQVEEGAVWLEQFARDQPQDVRARSARIGLGRVYEARHRWKDAAREYQALIDIRPADLEAQGLLAGALAGQDLFPDAIPHYQAYLSGFPGDSGGWTGLGIALIATSRARDAIAAFRRAVELDPRSSQFHRNLARALLASGSLGEGSEHARLSVALGPNDPAAHDVLGTALVAAGELGHARLEFDRALALDPSDPVAIEFLRRLPAAKGSK
jgi:tetratricopeptide (TPR) repeat protein